MAAKLFFQSKVFEAVALIVEHNKKSPERGKVRISSQDIKSLENVAAYINDHYNREILLDKLARIACMGTTKLKITFKQVYYGIYSTAAFISGRKSPLLHRFSN